MKIYLKHLYHTLSALSLSFILLGCPPKQKPNMAEDLTSEETAEKTQEDSEVDAAAEGPAIEIGTQWGTVAELGLVYFGYNSADLSREARETLKSNAGVLKTILKHAPSVKIRLEGHCDERGTLEYNLGLGQRRANSLKKYYASFGISKAKLSTISYGEERPACHELNDSCWSRNRRGATSLLSEEGPVRIPLGA